MNASEHLVGSSEQGPNTTAIVAGVSPALRGMAGWRAEFYPVGARKVAAEHAAAHSLRKWEGLRPEALAKHGVRLTGGSFGLCAVAVDDSAWDHVSISSSTCALCERFLMEDEDGDESCRQCPLAIARGGTSCLGEREDEARSPWAEWTATHDPAPMIRWLQVTVDASRGE